MENIRDYQTFKSVSEMDNFISDVLTQVDLKKTERELLWLLSGYSVKFVGVSFLKLDSMAQLLKKSKRTIQRALKGLCELGIIKRIETIRPVRGGFGSSLTIICPFALSTRKEAEKPAPEPAQGEEKKKETFSFKTLLKDIKYIRHQEEIDYTYLAEFVPEEFIQASKPFVKPEEVYSLWGKAQVIAQKYAPDVQHIIEPAIRAFKASVLAYKMKRIKGSFGGYYWGALQGILSVEQRRAHSDKLWNWLEEQ